MANVISYQKTYVEAYKELAGKYDVSGLIMLSELNYDEIQKLAECKNDPKLVAKDYSKRVNSYFEYILSTFFRMSSVKDVYETHKALYERKYLDNTDDDTNDYSDETIQKLNRIYSFINSNIDRDFTGIELLSGIRKAVNGEKSEGLEDDYYEVQIRILKNQSELIKESDLETKMSIIPTFFVEMADMQNHLLRKKLFKNDYRKSITGIANFFFMRAGLPLIYVKPIELDDYYGYITKVNELFDNSDLIAFYQEKMSESIEETLILPMKESIKPALDLKKTLIMNSDTEMDDIRLE